MQRPADSTELLDLSRIANNNWDIIFQELRQRGADRLLEKFPDAEDLDFVTHGDFTDRGGNVLPYKLRLMKSETETTWVYFNYFDKRAPSLTFIREYQGVDPSELHYERLEGNTAGDVAMEGPFEAFQYVDDAVIRNYSFRAVIKALFVSRGIIAAEDLLVHGSTTFYKHFISGLKILNGFDPTTATQRGIRRKRVEEEARDEPRSPPSGTQEADSDGLVTQTRRVTRASGREGAILGPDKTTPQRLHAVNAPRVGESETSYDGFLEDMGQQSDASGSESRSSSVRTAEAFMEGPERRTQNSETRSPELGTSTYQGDLSYDDDQPDEPYKRIRKLECRILDATKAGKDVKRQIQKQQEELKGIQEEAKRAQDKLKRMADQLATWEHSKADDMAKYEREWKGLTGNQIWAYTHRFTRTQEGRDSYDG